MFRCASCGSHGYSVFGHINGYELDKCLKCTLLQTRVDSHDRQVSIKSQYNDVYALERKNDQQKLNRRFDKHTFLLTRFKKSGNLLDVGCGVGYFLKHFGKSHPNWKLFGMEPNPILRKAANQFAGIKVKDGVLNNIPFQDHYFDVVTCYDVMEHSTNIQTNLAELRRVLKPGGILFIQAPNCESFMAYFTGRYWDWWAVPDHVIHFSYKTLKKILEHSGYKILNSYTYDDPEDYLSNLKGVFSRNLLSKMVYFSLIPIFIFIERIGWWLNKGGLSVVLAQKN